MSPPPPLLSFVHFVIASVVAAGTESVPVGADIGTIVHSEEDIEFYQQAQKAQGTLIPYAKTQGSSRTRFPSHVQG